MASRWKLNWEGWKTKSGRIDEAEDLAELERLQALKKRKRKRAAEKRKLEFRAKAGADCSEFVDFDTCD